MKTKITRKEIRYHSKASEKYIDVEFNYDNLNFNISIPIEYRRTGTSIEDNEIDEYLDKIYKEISPENIKKWKIEQINFWNTKPKAKTTKAFFDILSKEVRWFCVSCELPENPNWARRIQDLKEFGYTISTRTNTNCQKCKKKTTQLCLIPIRKGGVTGYETWSPKLRDKIIKTLKVYDSYEAKTVKKEGLLPDHKFPEIRWDSITKRECLEKLTDKDIKRDFQLLSNQRNLQKREVCRNCFQTNIRGNIFGIKFFYKGDENWDPNIPKIGKEAENGCIGCPWYDIEEWRKSIETKLKS
ncbi:MULTISPECIES: restriction endonuclease [Francisella]|uniref:Restriction endonuclease n=1 Tax=Francisella philomiragia TaxID=28110 RepID=A0ABS1G954_9GAMM|nr:MULTISPECIES: restriction endonuclease [Francisella]MBK2257658.1 restriction endonuclease [Francisella philomiragia]MBK2301346.1 restriction endonuclease [Francisella philomiragia]QIW10567.1 restriction endonuclease [Francisella sp. LA112445]